MTTVSDRMMMESPGRWPLSFLLPVKRYTSPNKMPELGFIAVGWGAKVFRANAYDFLHKIVGGSADMEMVSFYEYATFDATIADGWIVD